MNSILIQNTNRYIWICKRLNDGRSRLRFAAANVGASTIRYHRTQIHCWTSVGWARKTRAWNRATVHYLVVVWLLPNIWTVQVLRCSGLLVENPLAWNCWRLRITAAYLLACCSLQTCESSWAVASLRRIAIQRGPGAVADQCDDRVCRTSYNLPTIAWNFFPTQQCTSKRAGNFSAKFSDLKICAEKRIYSIVAIIEVAFDGKSLSRWLLCNSLTWRAIF